MQTDSKLPWKQSVVGSRKTLLKTDSLFYLELSIKATRNYLDLTLTLDSNM